jgi:hypothetical protein
MSKPNPSNVTPLVKFGKQSSKFSSLPCIAYFNKIVQPIKDSISRGLKPGWHTATIAFELDEDGSLISIDEYKISSFGGDKP